MPARKGLLAPQNTFLDTIATRFDGTRKWRPLDKKRLVFRAVFAFLTADCGQPIRSRLTLAPA